MTLAIAARGLNVIMGMIMGLMMGVMMGVMGVVMTESNALWVDGRVYDEGHDVLALQ